MMWCQWQLVRTRMRMSKWLKGGAEGQKIQNIKDKKLLLKNSKFILTIFFKKSIHLWFGHPTPNCKRINLLKKVINMILLFFNNNQCNVMTLKCLYYKVETVVHIVPFFLSALKFKPLIHKSKSQIVSDGNCGVFNFSKNQRNYFKDFCPSLSNE